MEHYEMVEQLVLKTGVTYEEAKEALETCNWDLWEAFDYLEKLGKVEKDTAVTENTEEGKSMGFGEACGRFFGFVAALIEKGNQNYLDILHKGKHVLSLPVTVLVLLLLLGFWCIIPLMIVGLFFQFQYRFRGTAKEKEVNDVLNRASNAVESVKREMKGKKG